MVSHICLFVELGPICNSMAVAMCLKSCEDNSLLKNYNGGQWIWARLREEEKWRCSFENSK